MRYCSLPHPPAPHPPAPPPLAFYIVSDAILKQIVVLSQDFLHWNYIKFGLKWGINHCCRTRGCEMAIKFVSRFLKNCYSVPLYGTQLTTCHQGWPLGLLYTGKITPDKMIQKWNIVQIQKWSNIKTIRCFQTG